MLGLLFGGNSLEREISIITAYQVYDKVKKIDKCILLYVDEYNNLFIADKMKLIDFKKGNYKKLKKTCFVQKGIKKTIIDCMIILGHGENSEDGIFSGLCRFYNIKFIGSDIFSSSLAMNKYYTYKYFHNKFKMVKTKLYTLYDYLNSKEVLEYPFILKPLCGGSSIDIFIIHNKEELIDNVNKIFKTNRRVIAQPFLQNALEFNIALNETKISKLELITKKDEYFSFTNKYNDSFKQTHQVFNEKYYNDFAKIAREIYNYGEFRGIIRLDFFLYNDEIYLNEINTIPGALSIYLFDDFISVIKDSIKLEYQRINKVYKGNLYLHDAIINK